MRRRSLLALVAMAGVSLPTRAWAQRPAFTGRRIDIELQGATLDEVLELFRDIGPANIVKQHDVRAGLVTVRFESIRWDEALYRILRAQRLEMVRDGNIIYVCPEP